MAPTAQSIADAIAARLRRERPCGAPAMHRTRRELSKQLAAHDASTLIDVCLGLLASPDVPGARLLACGIAGARRDALERMSVRQVEAFGGDLASWGDVDIFACLLAGRAWRDGKLGDGAIRRWARSRDRWWRRAALVSTVPLNVRAQGGTGDAARTLAVCVLLVDDRDDMVEKALSWALRELAVRDPAPVAAFVTEHERSLAARVRREVLSKLGTGLKSPKRRAPGKGSLDPRARP